jgi:hypothetical protein
VLVCLSAIALGATVAPTLEERWTAGMMTLTAVAPPSFGCSHPASACGGRPFAQRSSCALP